MQNEERLTKDGERLQKQLDFILELDKLKYIQRQSYVADASRHENDAEHSWHLALMAIRRIWEEFEAGVTPEARFAAALDHIQPIMLNDITGGRAWREHGVAMSQVIGRNSDTHLGSEILWRHTESLVEKNRDLGNLKNA